MNGLMISASGMTTKHINLLQSLLKKQKHVRLGVRVVFLLENTLNAYN